MTKRTVGPFPEHKTVSGIVAPSSTPLSLRCPRGRPLLWS
jgi:hypothetical protein